jgi:hypothetical protein
MTTRNELRAALIGKKHLPNSERVQLFGVEIELRQPTLSSILKSREEDDERKRTTDVFLNYAYVPGTDELIFEEGDRDTILNWPFSEELFQIQMIIAKLTGVDIGTAMEDIQTDPLPESS